MAVSLNFLPRDLRKALMPFQKDGIRYGIEKNGRCLIGDEMGLGKTLQALSVAYYFKDDWPLLIIVPSSMKYPWVDEIEKWLPEIPPEHINLIKNCSDLTALSKAKINILSYGLVSLRSGLNSMLIEAVKKANIGVAIVDESHYVKNRQTSRTQRIMQLLKQMKRVILLTGTPSLARPEELFVQINIVRPGLVGNWHNFGERYCDGHYILQTMRGGKVLRKYDTRGASNLKELHEILTKSLMIRRLKCDVLTELPAKRRQRIRFDIVTDSDRKKNLEASLKHFKKTVSQFKDQLNVLDDARLLTMSDVNSALTSLYKSTGLAKAGPIQEYISDLLDAMPNKFVVFCYHLAVIDAVTEVLAKRGTRYIRIAGDVPPEIRANYVREFQTQPYCRVAVLSITAASMGITLTAADHVVFAELHWTPGVIKQAEDRCHRIGQKNAVQIHFLTAKGTIDDVLWSMLSRKLTVTSETLDGEAQLLTADDGDEGKSQLLSICQAWFPDEDEEDDADLFTPKVKKRDENQRDIRACFVKSAENKKRKMRSYYEKGLMDISDSSDDNQEFKPQHKRGKRRKVLKGSEPVDHKVHQMVILDSSCDEKDTTEDLQGPLHHQDGKGDSNEIRKKDFPALATKPLQFNDTKLEHLEEAASVAERIQLVDGRPKELEIRCDTTSGSGNEEFLEENLEATELPSRKVHGEIESIHTESTCCKEGMVEQDLEKEKFIVGRSKGNTLLQCTVSKSTKEKDVAMDLCALNKNEKHKTDEMKKISSSNKESFGSEILLECDAGSQNAETIYRKETVTGECNKKNSWNCVACTFLNHEDLNTCEMCDSERPKSFVQTRSRVLASDLVAAASEVTNSRKPTKSKARNNSAKTRVLENESASIEIVGNGDHDSQSEALPSTEAAVTLENNTASVIEVPSPSKEHFPDITCSDFEKLSTCTTGLKNDITQPDQYVDRSMYKVSGLSNTVNETNKLAVDTDDKLASSNSFTGMRNQGIATEPAVSSSESLAKKPGMQNTSKHDASDSEVSTITDSSSEAENDWFDRVNIGPCNKRSDLKPSKRKEAPKKPFSVERVLTMTNDVTCRYYSSLDTEVNPMSTSKKFNECFVDSPLMFSSSEDSSNGPEIIESIAIAGFKKASGLLQQEQLERDRKYDGEGCALLSASGGTADSNVVNLSSLSDEDSDAAVYLNPSAKGLHEALPHRIGKSPALDSRISEKEKGNGACKDDTEFLLDGDFDDEISLVSSEKSESEAESEEEVQPVELMFKMSFESDRVYLYNANEEPLSVNLRIPDLGFLSNDDLPRIFSHPFNLKQLKKLAREWSLLTNTKQRMIRKSGLVFKSPLDAYNRLKEARYGSPSNERFSSKEKRNKNIKTIASIIGGTVAEIKDSKHQRYGNRNQPEAGKSSQTDASSHDPNETDPQTLLQAVDSEGDPLCLFCNSKVQNGFKAGTRQARFCSYNCQEEYLFRTSKSRIVRERLFSSEHGVCQLCQFDAHQLFARIAALRKKDRKAALEATHFVNLPAASLNKIIADPKEGKFWEADHINAVSEGGGECGLENYRTLCIPCHRDVTKDLHKRLRHKRKIDKSKAEGIADIGGYFASSNPGSRSRKETKTHDSKDCPGTGTLEPTARKPSANANGSLSPNESQCMEVFATNTKTSLKGLASTAKALGNVSQKVIKSDEQQNEIYAGPNFLRSMNVKQHTESHQHASASLTVIGGTGKPIISLKRQPEVSSVNISHAVKSLTRTVTTKPAVRKNPIDVACSSKTLKETFTLTSYDNEKNTLTSREKMNLPGSNIRSKNEGNELPGRRTNVNKNLSEPVLPNDNEVPKKAKQAKACTANCERSPVYKSAKGTKKSFIEVTEEEMKKSDEKIAALIAKSAENRNHTKK
ncbi:uncharacterized protein LOC135689576 isoform X1 [Rhopilema esculentum]|uniref:uncharacterized protein LOC135689576 isoform X1 n=1 Tax=Rhopilema esculentum TaxID=499914 RepID=UPI0031D9B3E2